MIKISCCPIIFFAQFIFSKLQLHSQFHQKDKEKDGGHTATLKENHFICANISSGKQSQHNTAGNCRTKHACQIRPHSVHEKKYIPAFLLPYKMRNAGSNWYGRNTC